MSGQFYRCYLKRPLDVLIAAIALVLLAPLLGIVSLLVFISMGRPIVFRQTRVGRGEKTFQVVKFRTMTQATNVNGLLLPDSQRLTWLGRQLRAFSLDELPQLWNIFRGDMSLIGPRPLLVSYLPYYTDRERLRHTVLPGVTGLAQVNGRNELEWDRRLEFDARYVERCSAWLDLWIAVQTVGKVLRRSDVRVITELQWFGSLPEYRRLQQATPAA